LGRLSDRLSRKILIRSLNKDSGDRLIRYGSLYGGWTICRCSKHFSETGILISAGVGEDISFDVDLLRTSDLIAVLIDPTDRAENHVKSYLASFEKLAEPQYTNDGNQLISNYFSNDNVKKRINFIKKALWKSTDGVNLYPPDNDSHVSYRLSRNSHRKNLSRKFPSIDIRTIIAHNESERNYFIDTNFIVLKMDIEGSELSVLKNLRKTAIRPRQILVELDFMREKITYLQTLKLFVFLKAMKKWDYRLSQFEKLNCLFLDNREES